MTSRTLQMKPSTLKRKLAEQEAARREGRHLRWLGTRSLPGSGIKVRLTCMKTQLREIHLLSSSEQAAFLELWWDESVLTVYDQVAIPQNASLKAATQIDVEHPTYKPGGELIVLSTDLVAIRQGDGRMRKTAYSVKDSRNFKRAGETDRQRIERRVWENEGAEFKVFLADGMRAPRSKNLAWLLAAENAMTGRALSLGEILAQKALLFRIRRRVDTLVIDACRAVDRQAELEPGSGARAFRQLAATKRTAFDLSSEDPIRIPVSEITLETRRRDDKDNA